MTRNEFLEFLKTDPVFKVSDKQLVATLYESPFDNVVLDEDAGELTLTLHGEDFMFTGDDPDFAQIIQENPCLWVVIQAKRAIISAGFRISNGNNIIAANDTDITTNALIPFPAADEGGDDDNGGGGIG